MLTLALWLKSLK